MTIISFDIAALRGARTLIGFNPISRPVEVATLTPCGIELFETHMASLTSRQISGYLKTEKKLNDFWGELETFNQEQFRRRRTNPIYTEDFRPRHDLGEPRNSNWHTDNANHGYMYILGAGTPEFNTQYKDGNNVRLIGAYKLLLAPTRTVHRTSPDFMQNPSSWFFCRMIIQPSRYAPR